MDPDYVNHIMHNITCSKNPYENPIQEPFNFIPPATQPDSTFHTVPPQKPDSQGPYFMQPDSQGPYFMPPSTPHTHQTPNPHGHTQTPNQYSSSVFNPYTHFKQYSQQHWIGHGLYLLSTQINLVNAL
jgi:hypothetical protein